MKYSNIREEALKNKVGADWFKGFDITETLGSIVFYGKIKIRKK